MTCASASTDGSMKGKDYVGYLNHKRANLKKNNQ